MGKNHAEISNEVTSIMSRTLFRIGILVMVLGVLAGVAVAQYTPLPSPAPPYPPDVPNLPIPSPPSQPAPTATNYTTLIAIGVVVVVVGLVAIVALSRRSGGTHTVA